MNIDNLEESKKQLEAVRRSGKTNMYNIDNIKKISIQCGLPHLTDKLIELDNEDYIEFMEDSIEEFRESDDNEIEEIAERIRETRVTKEI